MEKNIKIHIKDRVAVAEGDPVIVCGNDDYTVTFSFDEEWGGANVKTARFKFNTAEGPEHIDQPFTGDTVEVPELSNIREVEVGVFVGDLNTTTGASIRCKPCIRCGSGAPKDPTPDVYDELMELINDMKEPDEIPDDAITEKKLTDGCVTSDKIAESAVGGQHIENEAIDGHHIKNDSIGDGHLCDWAVTASKLFKDAVTTEKIKDGAVTPEKLDRVYATEKYVDEVIEAIEFPAFPDVPEGDTRIPTALSDLTDDAEHRLVTDEEKAKLETVASAFDFNFNLFDKSTATAGSYIDGTEIKSNAAYCVSAYIEIKPLTHYIVPSILNNLGSEFDENKTFLQKITRSDISQPDVDKTLIYTGSKAKYLRVNIFVGPGTPENVRDINTFMVLEGTEYPETFIPYNGLKPILKPDCIIGDEEATDTGEIEKVINAFDFNFNLFDKDAATVGSYAVRENIVNNSSYYVSDYIEVKPLTYYVVPNTASQVGSCFDKNKTYLGQLKRSSMPQPYSDKTIIFTTATTKYIRVNGFSGVASAYVTCPINEYMVIEGKTYPENYTPYNGLKPLIKPDCIPENKELVDRVNRSNILYGKTLMTIGDSITRGLMIAVSEETGYELTYGGLTAYRNDMKFINTGWSGGTIANDQVKPFINNGVINVALGDTVPDYLTIWYGWNDYAREAILLGDINSTDETTYYGAWNIALNLLINKYPTTKIGVIVPYGMNAEWRQAVRDVAKKWGVPYLDLYENQSCIFDNEYGVEPSIAELRKATFLADHCHPNSAGYEWLSTMYEAFLRRM